MKLEGWKEFYYPIGTSELHLRLREMGLKYYEYSSDLEYCESCKVAYLNVEKFMDNNSIKKWWFLHYGTHILVRYKYAHSNDSVWEEDDYKFTSEYDMKCFADIMMIIRKMFYARLNGKQQYNIGRFLERVQHCMYNALHGPFDEVAFHKQLIDVEVAEDLSKFRADLFNKAVYEHITI